MIALARHGQTADNVEGRFQGQLDVPLDAVGERQAVELADAAAQRGDFVALYCSPLRRARQTAEVVGARLGLSPRDEPRFAEHDTGDWTGRLKADIAQEEPELWAAHLAGGPFRFPGAGGESLQDLMDRVVEGLVAVTQAGELPALVVCHRGVIRAARAHTHVRGLATFHDWEVPNAELIAL